MHRLLFEKTGNAVWISHLDLMRVFQRAFKRAGLALTHTQGFNPRPSVSIALPLSVGVQSRCELLDFELEGQVPSCTELCTMLNDKLIAGVRVLDAYENGRKLKYLQYLSCEVILGYDFGMPANAEEQIHKLFRRDSLTVPKKTKSGIQDQDILPMIHALEVKSGANELMIQATVSCQNPSLNPAQLAAAVTLYLPQYTPDFVLCKRIELMDEEFNVFR